MKFDSWNSTFHILGRLRNYCLEDEPPNLLKVPIGIVNDKEESGEGKFSPSHEG